LPLSSWRTTSQGSVTVPSFIAPLHFPPVACAAPRPVRKPQSAYARAYASPSLSEHAFSQRGTQPASTQGAHGDGCAVRAGRRIRSAAYRPPRHAPGATCENGQIATAAGQRRARPRAGADARAGGARWSARGWWGGSGRALLHRKVVRGPVTVGGNDHVRRLHRPAGGEVRALDDQDDMAGDAAQQDQFLGE